MNEHHLPPDELASAFLDDELAGADAAAVRDDPELAARADALREAGEAVGQPVTPPPGAEDAAVAAALADFDARQVAPLDTSRRQSRNLRVITGVAAAVAVGFIVAAAIGLFAETGSDEDAAAEMATTAQAADMAAAPAPPPAAEPPPPAAPAPAPAADDEAPSEPAPEPAQIALEEAQDTAAAALATAAEALEAAEAATAAAELAQATAEGNNAAVAAAEAALSDTQAVADQARAEAAAAQAEAATSQAEAAEARTAAADGQAAAAAVPEPPPPAAASPDDETDELADIATSPAERCADAIGNRRFEMHFTVDAVQVVVLRVSDDRLAALDGATCAEIPADDPTEMATDPTPDDCAADVGATTIELQITIGDTTIILVRAPDEQLAALDGGTCAILTP